MDEIRVLRILNRLVVGGPLVNVAELTMGLGTPYRTLLAGGPPSVSEMDARPWLREQGIEPVTLPRMFRWPSLFDDIRSYCHIRRLISEFKPHIVHTHGAKSGFLGRLAARHARVPVKVHTYHGHTFHSYFKPWKQRVFRRVEKWINRRTEAIVVLSKLQKKDILEKFKVAEPGQVRIIPLGMNMDTFLTAWKENRIWFRKEYGAGDAMTIGWLGRMAEIKDPALFVDVIHELWKTGSRDFKAYMIGDGEIRLTCMWLAEHYFGGDAGSIIGFPSWIYPAGKAMAGLDILVLTSLNEGTPLSIVQAQAAGIPVVAIPVGGIPDMIEHGVTGLLVDGRDMAALAKAVQALLADRELYTQISENAKAEALERYSHHRLCSDMADMYSNLLSVKS